MVSTLDRDHVYFAKTDKEREIWLEGFAKIINYNRCTDGQFNLKAAADLSNIKD